MTKDIVLKKIPLVELFGPTVQGEGAVIGAPTYFLRFGLCDYDCKLCDSRHAVEPEQVRANAEWITQTVIHNQLVTYRSINHPTSCRTVTFSGGNPCIHDLSVLVHTLKDSGWKIHVETQGTFHPDWLFECDSVTCSPKAPGIGEKFDPKAFEEFMAAFDGSMNYEGLSLKIVVFDLPDLEFAGNLAFWCANHNFPLEQFYLSQGNPYPPGIATYRQDDGSPNTIRNLLVTQYLALFDQIQKSPLLSSVKFLPQLHVWLHGNKQGV
jgi:7-carboxy-7-deazaguanine synthase